MSFWDDLEEFGQKAGGSFAVLEESAGKLGGLFGTVTGSGGSTAPVTQASNPADFTSEAGTTGGLFDQVALALGVSAPVVKVGAVALGGVLGVWVLSSLLGRRR